MVSLDNIRDILFGRCKKLIKYQKTTIVFKGFGVGVKDAKVSLSDFATDVKKVAKATELAKALDDYQYFVCRITRSLRKDDPDREWYVKIRVAAIGLITAARITLEAFKLDPKNESKNLGELVRTVQTFMKNVANMLVPGIMTRYVPSTRPRKRTVSRAFIVAGLKESGVNSLIGEMFKKNIRKSRNDKYNVKC